MSTAYLVKCPRIRCRWFGELPARPDPDAWRESHTTVTFECPRCRCEWRARLVNNTATPLPEQSTDELEPALFDLGDGD